MTSPRGGLAILVFVLGACTRGGATPPQANTLQRAPEGLVTDAGQSAADPVEASAREVVAALARGDFAGVTRTSTTRCATRCPKARRSVSAAASRGPSVRLCAIERVRLVDFQGHRIAFVRCRFQGGEEGIEGRLRGLTLASTASSSSTHRRTSRGRRRRTLDSTRSAGVMCASAMRRSCRASLRCRVGRGPFPPSCSCTASGRKMPTRAPAA